MKLSNGFKFALVGIAFLLVALGAFIAIGIMNGWDMLSWLTSPLAIVIYACLGCVGCWLATYFVNKGIRK